MGWIRGIDRRGIDGMELGEYLGWIRRICEGNDVRRLVGQFGGLRRTGGDLWIDGRGFMDRREGIYG